MLRNSSEVKKLELATKQRKTKQVIRKNKKIWEKSRTETKENNYKNNTIFFFKNANEVKNRFRPRSAMLKYEEGKLIVNNNDVIKYFKNVLKKNTKYNNPNIMFPNKSKINKKKKKQQPKQNWRY